MEEIDQPGLKRERIIEEPDITNPNVLGEWLDKYVQKPFVGFDDKKHPDGTPYSMDEQIGESKTQLRTVVEDFTKMGRSPEQIKSTLMLSVRGLQKDNEQKS